MDLIYAVNDNGSLKTGTEGAEDLPCIAVYLTGSITLRELLKFIHVPLIFAGPDSEFKLAGVADWWEDPANSPGEIVGLCGRLGKAATLELLLTATSLNAAQAAQFGLINDILTREQFDERLARLSKLSLSAIELAVDISRRAAHLSHRQAEQLERYAFALRFTHRDQREGMSAFLEKRAPNFPQS